VPVFNEEQSISEFHKRLIDVVDSLEESTRIIYIDDGSSDNTAEILLNLVQNDDRVCIVQLSRNFGHQAALSAGLDLADADLIMMLDGDGQHPPELIPRFIELQKGGFDVVQGQRLDTNKTPLGKKLTSKWFYSVINNLGSTKIAEGTSDFRLITRQVVEAYLRVHDYHRFIRGIIPWLGFSETLLQYTAVERIAGKSKYSLSKMLVLAENAIFSFSITPLRIGLAIGLLFLILALIEAIYVASFWITGKQALLTPGWGSLVFLVLISGGALMIMTSIIGIYVGQISQQVKNRPLYIIRKIHKKL
ncbi:MAG: glycosyltransferase family 2 protein, partial [Bacillota bacterium]